VGNLKTSTSLKYFIHSSSFFLRYIVLILLLYGLNANAKSTTARQQTAKSEITTENNIIRLDGKPFIARGVIFEGFLEPTSWLQECVQKKWESENFCSRHLDSRNYYFGLNNYAHKDALTLAINDWNINTVRFNVSQTALDPKSEWFTPAYLDEIKKVTELARQKGLTVILALFPASNKNAPILLQERNPNTPLNTSATLNAALTLGKMFGQDGNIMIELLNEPWSPGRRTEGWRLLYEGGIVINPRSPFNGKKFIGYQEIITELRSAGAKNHIIVQGLHTSYEQAPSGLQDPLNKIIYSVHPFFGDAQQNPAQWDQRFGNFAKNNRFMITAWNAKQHDPWCNVSGADTLTEFLKYVKKLNIGMVVYAFDVPSTITKNFQEALDQPSKSTNKCKKWGGAGEAVQQYFKEQ
jgi:hypothetical protein